MAKRNKTARAPRGSKRAASKPRAKARRSSGASAVAVARAAVPPSGLAPGMQPVNTYLAVANVAATMAFLERAFGFTKGVVLPDSDGQLRYAEMRHGDSAIMLVPRGDATSPTSGNAVLYTYVDDVDAALTRARDAGAGVGVAEDKAWGDRVGNVTDPDGYRWMLATFRKLAPMQMETERRKGADRRKTGSAHAS